MLFRNLIKILGLTPWEIKIPWYLDFFIMKRKASSGATILIKKHSPSTLSSYSPARVNNIYVEDVHLDYKNCTFRDFTKILLYNLYYLTIFTSLCIQPVNLIIEASKNEDLRIDYVNLFMLYSLLPINYLWSKYYFSTTHFEDFFLVTSWKCTDYCNKLCIFSIFASLGSIIPYVVYTNQLSHYWSYDTDYFWVSFIIIEFIGRLIILVNTGVFLLVFKNHLNTISKVIKDIETPGKYDFHSINIISSLIVDIATIKSELECSINYFTYIISPTTAIGTAGVILFCHHKFVNKILYFTSIDYYTIVGLIYYILTQFIFFKILMSYSYKRSIINRYINSKNFITQYIERTNLKKPTSKTHQDKNLIILEEESATTLDWLILDKLTKENWIDFVILGISTRDGSLIKKVLTFSTLFYTLLKFF